MPKWIPIAVEPHVDAAGTDLLQFHYTPRSITAKFQIPRDWEHALNVHFRDTCIVRIMDEFSLDTEVETTPNEGRVPEQFAYRIEGAQFEQSQPNGFKRRFPTAKHYRFVAGPFTCLDVISAAEPKFSVVEYDYKDTPADRYDAPGEELGEIADITERVFEVTPRVLGMFNTGGLLALRDFTLRKARRTDDVRTGAFGRGLSKAIDDRFAG